MMSNHETIRRYVGEVLGVPWRTVRLRYRSGRPLVRVMLEARPCGGDWQRLSGAQTRSIAAHAYARFARGQIVPPEVVEAAESLAPWLSAAASPFAHEAVGRRFAHVVHVVLGSLP